MWEIGNPPQVVYQRLAFFVACPKSTLPRDSVVWDWRRSEGSHSRGRGLSSIALRCVPALIHFTQPSLYKHEELAEALADLKHTKPDLEYSKN